MTTGSRIVVERHGRRGAHRGLQGHEHGRTPSCRYWLRENCPKPRAGSSPDQADLSQVASASNAGGTVRFHLSTPAHARYLLIWFTKLPPDNAGTYQANVYRIAAQGQP